MTARGGSAGRRVAGVRRGCCVEDAVHPREVREARARGAGINFA